MIKAVGRLNRGLARGTIKPKVGPQGAITFIGFDGADRDGVTDACAYRRIMQTGSQQAKLAIMKAEQMAGRSVDRQALAQAIHSHDGGEIGTRALRRKNHARTW